MRRRDFIMLVVGAAPMLSAWPEAQAQEVGRTYRLGVLASNPRRRANWVAFFGELRKYGFIEGTNLSIVNGFETPVERAEMVATAIVKAQPDAIITSSAMTRIVQRGTQTIPILAVSDDLLAEQAITSLAHPGGNTTGISILATELDGKRQEILLEAVPAAGRVAILADPAVTRPQQLQRLEDEARAHGVRVSIHLAAKSEDIIQAVDGAAAEGAEALNVLASALLDKHRAQIIERTALTRLPAIYQWPEIAEEGGLIAYGPRLVALYRQHALQAMKVLKGTKPADIPVEQPAKFELVINLKTAKALGLTVPSSLLARADEVIE